ncbi:MAG TPA: dTDP-4-dehydrorhamnose reductase [Candidatus Acidoferrum sp.]|nr:dTDP-4-dehydrorhamnose reductase [Candidatus Acidoferrum sp.]
MKVTVIGANGQLGMDVADEFARNGDEVCRLTHAEIDISPGDSVHSVLAAALPALIVNTAAMHHVEQCEQNPLQAYAVNALGARNLAIAARQLGAALIHVSTDYVFDGAKRQPYLEGDPALPLNVYGNTKLAGEAFIQTCTEKYYILRTSALYGRNPCRAKGGRNFVELMLTLAKECDELRVVNDECVSPTSTAELARQMVVLSRTAAFGLYHATAEGSCTWYEFARKIFELMKAKVSLKIATENEFPAKVSRPKYSVLENNKLKILGANSFRSWEDGLRSYLVSAHHLN